MKRKLPYLLAATFAILFAVLSLIYLLDGNRRQTRYKLFAVSKDVISHDFMLSSLNVTSITQDSRKLMWIGTSAGVNVFNGKDYTQYFHDSRDTTALPDDYVNVVFRDKAGHIWVGTQNGLARYEGANRFKRFQIPDRNLNITDIKDAQGRNGYVMASNGTNEYLVSDHSVKRQDKAQECSTLPSRELSDSTYPHLTDYLAKPKEMISCHTQDAGSNEWVGYRNGGYQVISNNMVSYLQANRNALAQATKGKDIICLRRTGNHILAGTTLRLYDFNTATGQLAETLYKDLFKLQDGNGTNNVELVDLIPIGNERICLVSPHEVVECRVNDHAAGLSSRKTLWQSHSTTEEWVGMGGQLDNHVYVTAEKNLLLDFDMTTGKTTRIRVSSPWYDSETQLAPLHNGDLLLFMKNMHLAIYSPRNHRFKFISLHSGPQDASIDPAFAMQDRHGTVWLGTKRYGLYELDLKANISKRSHAVNDVHVQGMAEDTRGQLWITTLKDAVCYHPTDGTVMMNSLVSSSQNGWQRQFFDNAICLSPDSCIVLGSSDGCIFLPSSSGNRYLSSNKYVKGNKLQTYDHSTSLEGGLCIYGLEVKTRSGQQMAMADLRIDGQHYTFSHDENSLAFRFFYPNYTRRSALLYQYKMEGLDDDWHTPTYDNLAEFENIPAGHYKFRIRLLTSLSRPPLAEREVDICVKPAPWACSAAWLLYVALAICLLGYINSLYLRIRTNRLLLANEQREKERERHTNEMNMSFFANISHEFRNPLTIIAGPLLSLKSDETVPKAMRSSLNRVCLSVNRMLRLIDQMLDFNQLESDALRLRIVRKDVAAVWMSGWKPFRKRHACVASHSCTKRRTATTMCSSTRTNWRRL